MGYNSSSEVSERQQASRPLLWACRLHHRGKTAEMARHGRQGGRYGFAV